MIERLTTRTPARTSRVVVVFCVRNEVFRLAYFLNYYRELGVTEFYAVDNASDDGSLEYLFDQKDVNLFSTSASYKSSNAGRDWTSNLCDTYLTQRWCLTLDVDEFFIYPYCEYLNLDAFIDYLDVNSYDGATSLFLDFYSNQPLSKTHYETGQSPFDVCGFHDVSSQYFIYPNENFPFYEIKGGPRQRTFWSSSDLAAGPSMRKTVLVKWKSGFAYLVAAHSCTPIRLADVTTVVAHFKFLSHFKDFARQEVKRNERVANSKDWRLYAASLEKNDINFFEPDLSCEYAGSSSLLNRRLVAVSLRFSDYAASWARLNKSKKLLASLNQSVLKPSDSRLQFDYFLSAWSSFSLLSKQIEGDTAKQQELAQVEAKLDMAANSGLWRASYPFRKLASRFGLTDQRSLTEENYANQNLSTKFTFIYDSIWWDLLGPFRAIAKLLRRLGLLKYRQ